MDNQIPFSSSGIVRACFPPELKTIATKDGVTHVLTIRGAVPGAGQRDDMGQRKDGFFDFISWGPSAVAAAEVITKGMQFHFKGAPQHQEWGEGDAKRSRTVFVGEFGFLDKRTPSEDAHLNTFAPIDKEAAGSAPSSASADDDIPF
jgi:single-stranded DNA-binding protein